MKKSSFKLYKNIQSHIEHNIEDKRDKKLYLLINALENRRNKDIEIDNICFFSDEHCSDGGLSIGSHYFQENGILNKLSIGREVVVINEVNFAAPYKNGFNVTDINSTLKYPVFCSYHDNFVFEDIENDKIKALPEKEAFLYTLKSLAFHIFLTKKKEKILKWTLDNKDANELTAIFKHTGMSESDINSYFDEMKEKLDHFTHIIHECEVIKLKILKQYKNMEYNKISCTEISSAKFGMVFYCFNVISEESFLCVNILPSEKGSRILLTYFKNDFNSFMEDENLRDLFNGKLHPFLNKMILWNRGNLCYSAKTLSDEDMNCLNALEYENDFWDLITPKFFENS